MNRDQVTEWSEFHMVLLVTLFGKYTKRGKISLHHCNSTVKQFRNKKEFLDGGLRDKMNKFSDDQTVTWNWSYIA